MTLDQSIASHLAQFALTATKRGQPPRPNTIKSRRLHLEQFSRWIETNSPPFTGGQGGVNSSLIPPPSSLTVNLCKNFILQSFKALSPSDKNAAITAVTGLLVWLADEGQFPRDDLASWRDFAKQQFRPWRRRGPHHKRLYADQLEALFLALADNPNQARANRDIAFFGMILFGPSRLGEIQRLNYEHVQHFDSALPPGPMGGSKGGDSSLIPHPSSLSEGPHYLITLPAELAKDGEEHRIYLFAEQSRIAHINVYYALQNYLNWRGDWPGPLFVGIREGYHATRCSPTNWHQVLKTAAARAKVPMTSHYLRHTFGDRAAPVLDSRDLRQIFGHSSDRITQGYTDHDDEARLRAAQFKAAQAINQS